jgi:hypothetical protein
LTSLIYLTRYTHYCLKVRLWYVMIFMVVKSSIGGGGKLGLDQSRQRKYSREV